jgi:hypothetical protein
VLTYAVTAGHLADGDGFTGELARAAGENVDAYTIRKNTLTAGGNYTLTFVSAKLSIVPRPIGVTADALGKVAGEPDPILTFAVSSGELVGDDTFTGALTRDPGEDVGTYRIRKGSLALSSNYELSYNGAWFTITSPKPDLIPTSLSASASHAVANDWVQVLWDVTNDGAGDANRPGGWPDAAYLSLDTVLDAGDLRAGPAWYGDFVAAGSSYSSGIFMVVQPEWPAGDYYLLVTVDEYAYVDESDETNNITIGPIITITPPPPPPDFAPTALTLDATSALPVTQVTASWSVSNLGPGPVPANKSWPDSLYFSTDATLDGADYWVAYFWPTGPVAAGAAYDMVGTFYVPDYVPPDTYHVIVQVDQYGYVVESDEGNNVLTGPVITITALSGASIDRVGGLVLARSILAPRDPDWVDRRFSDRPRPGNPGLAAATERQDLRETSICRIAPPGSVSPVRANHA